jgi:hypothetical protein
MLVDHVLKSVARWISQAPTRGNASNARAAASTRRADGAAEAVPLRARRDSLERLQVDLDVGPHRAVGVDEPAVRGARLHADLAEACERTATA